MARLASKVWVDAYLTRLRLADIAVYVVARGDATSGAVIVKCATLDGQARAFQRSYDLLEDRRVWLPFAEGVEAEVDQVVARARQSDTDLWVIELEDRAGRTLLDQDGLRD